MVRFKDILFVLLFIPLTVGISSATASFSAIQSNGNVPFSVQFTDSSTYSPSSWSWDFGDGSISSGRNPIHKYTTAGVYTVTMTCNDAGGNNTSTLVNYITALVPKPLPVFIASPTSGNMPLNVVFTDRSTLSPTSYLWDFGDGVTSDLQNPTHTYTVGGGYTVKLTVTNSGGSNVLTKTNYIYAFDIAPVASFTTNNTSIFGDVQFTDTSINNPNRWEWNFGDGRTSNDQSPGHRYALNGTYPVTLMATNAGGTRITTQNVSVVALIQLQINSTQATPIVIEDNKGFNTLTDGMENWNSSVMIGVITSPFTNLIGDYFWVILILGVLVYMLITYGGKSTVPVVITLLFGVVFIGVIPMQWHYILWIAVVLGIAGAFYGLIRSKN